MMYVGMQFLVEAIKKAGSVDSDKVSAAMMDLTIDTPIGKQTMRKKDQQANRGEFYGSRYAAHRTADPGDAASTTA